MYKKIDFHVHYLTDQYRRFLMDHFGPQPENFKTPDWDIQKQLDCMEENQIVYALLGISSPYFCCGDTEKTIEAVRENNKEISSLLKGYEKRMGYLAALPMPDIRRSLEEIEKSMEEGAKGFTVNTHSDGIYLGNPILDPIMEKWDSLGSIVHIHPTEPSDVPEDVCTDFPIPAMEFFFDTTRTFVNMCLTDVFVRYPNIRFIFSHAGAFVPFLSDRLDVFFKNFTVNKPDLEQALRHVYFDVAGYAEPKQLEVLLNAASEDHILYGSDFPHTAPATVRKNSEALENTGKMSEPLKEKIFLTNGEHLLSSL